MKVIKKLVLVVMLAVLVCVPIVTSADQAVTITVLANGKTVYFPDQQPYIENSRVMVPLRAPLEAMGCSVSWNADKQQVTIRSINALGKFEAVFIIGSTTYTVNGKTQAPMDVAPEIKGDRIALPIRYAANAVGLGVIWDDDAPYMIKLSLPMLPPMN